MLELLKAHLAPLGGIVADEPGEADCWLFINAPAIKQGVGELQWAAQFSKEELLAKVPKMLREYAEKLFTDEYFQATRREMQTPRRSPEEFCRAVVEAVRRGKNVAIADVDFVNGGDLILGAQLIQHPEIARLAAFGGWNTAGNTLGTALAQAVIYNRENSLRTIDNLTSALFAIREEIQNEDEAAMMQRFERLQTDRTTWWSQRQAAAWAKEELAAVEMPRATDMFGNLIGLHRKPKPKK